MKIGEAVNVGTGQTVSFKSSNMPEIMGIKCTLSGALQPTMMAALFGSLLVNTKFTNESKSLILNTDLERIALLSQDFHGMLKAQTAYGLGAYTGATIFALIRQGGGQVNKDWQVDLQPLNSAFGGVVFTWDKIEVFGYSNSVSDKALAYISNEYSNEEVFDLPITSDIVKVMFSNSFDRLNISYKDKNEEVEVTEAELINLFTDEVSMSIFDAQFNTNNVLSMHDLNYLIVDNEEGLKNIQVKRGGQVVSTMTVRNV